MCVDNSFFHKNSKLQIINTRTFGMDDRKNKRPVYDNENRLQLNEAANLTESLIIYICET